MSHKTIYRDQISQIINQKTRPLIVISHSFEYSWTSQFLRGAWPLPDCYLSYDFKLKV